MVQRNKSTGHRSSVSKRLDVKVYSLTRKTYGGYCCCTQLVGNSSSCDALYMKDHLTIPNIKMLPKLLYPRLQSEKKFKKKTKKTQPEWIAVSVLGSRL